jgi:hypothetical protein
MHRVQEDEMISYDQAEEQKSAQDPIPTIRVSIVIQSSEFHYSPSSQTYTSFRRGMERYYSFSYETG